MIPRGQLDAIVPRVTVVRDRFDAVRKLAGPRGNVFALLGRIFSSGPWLSREELSAIAAFQPLLKREFLHLLWETDAVLERTRPLAIRCVKRRRLDDEILRAWWNAVRAVGHLSVLATMDSRDVITELPAEAPGLLSWPAVRLQALVRAMRVTARARRLRARSTTKRLLPVASNEASVAPAGSTLPMLSNASTTAAEAAGSVDMGNGQ